MNKFFKETIIWIFNLIPLVYLKIVWNQLPDKVITSFGFSGGANGWTDKNELPLVIGGIVIGTYLLMKFLPYFDPKKKIANMGDKYLSFRLIMTIFMSLLTVYILYVGSTGISNQNLLFGLLGLFFALQGNYMQTLRPNYFLGIRTPWTLENEETWRLTHRIGGRLWMAGGTLTILLSIIIGDKLWLSISFGIIIAIISIFPIIYSYSAFQKNKLSK
jgi:uncharacterized membrane protein